MEMKQKTEKRSEVPAKITPEAAMKAFRNFADAHAELSRRTSCKILQEKIPEIFEQYTPPPSSFPSHTDADLQRILEKELNDLKSFWGNRESLSPVLFDERCGWVPGYTGVVVGTNRASNPEIPLTENMAEMLILLSEPPRPHWEDERFIRDCFCDHPSDSVRLQVVLHSDALARLVNSLDGSQIAGFIIQTVPGQAHTLDYNIQRIACAINEDGVMELGRYLAIEPHDLSLTTLLERCGTDGKILVEKLLGCMRDIARELQERLDSLKGEQHE